MAASVNTKILTAVIFCASLLFLTAGALIKGPYIGADSNDFLTLGDKTISWMSGGKPRFRKLRNEKLFPNYIISSTYLSGARRFLGLDVYGVMVTNILLFSVMVCLVFKVWSKGLKEMEVAGGRWSIGLAVVGGSYILFGLPDVFLWTYAVLTDILFLFWATLFVVSISMLFLRGSHGWLLIAVPIALTAPLVRPTGMIMPLLLLYALFLLWYCRQRYSVRPLVWLSLGGLLGFVLVLMPSLVLMHLHGDPAVNNLIPDMLWRTFQQAVYFFRHGIIISTRLEVSYGELPSYFEIVQSIGYRLIYYWVPLRFGYRPYSDLHNAVNLVYIAAVWPLFIIGIRVLLRRGRNAVIWLVFLLIFGLCYALQHSITLVSFDWRYQLPGMIPLWIVAGCGLMHCLSSLSKSSVAGYGDIEQ